MQLALHGCAECRVSPNCITRSWHSDHLAPSADKAIATQGSGCLDAETGSSKPDPPVHYSMFVCCACHHRIMAPLTDVGHMTSACSQEQALVIPAQAGFMQYWLGGAGHMRQHQGEHRRQYWKSGTRNIVRFRRHKGQLAALCVPNEFRAMINQPLPLPKCHPRSASPWQSGARIWIQTNFHKMRPYLLASLDHAAIFRHK